MSATWATVTRADVILRAQYWVDRGVHYLDEDGDAWPATAPDPQGRAYRTDCSGYVAMAWNAPEQPDTCDFDSLGYEIAVDQLLPGDAVLWKGVGGYANGGGHVLLFHGWLDEPRTRYMAYELSGNSYARHHALPYPHSRSADQYVPWRCHRVVDR